MLSFEWDEKKNKLNSKKHKIWFEEAIQVFNDPTAILCDRGTLDGLAYWPGAAASFFRELGTTMKKELARYDVVIHMQSPGDGQGYHGDGIRTESASEAQRIDERLLDVWKLHPRRIVVPSNTEFIAKAMSVLDHIRSELPSECRCAEFGAVSSGEPAAHSAA